MKKTLFEYGPVAGSQAIESEFDMPEINAKFGNVQRVPVKQFLRSFKKGISTVPRDEYPHKNRILAYSHYLSDKIAKETQDLIKNSNINVACGKGCDACCYYADLNVVGFEMEEIVFFIQKRIAAETKNQLFSQILENPDFKKLDYKPCPFLNRTEGNCGIYAIRPNICRGFGSTKRCELEVDEAEGIENYHFYSERIIEKQEIRVGYVLIAQEAERKKKKKTNILRHPGETIDLKKIEKDKLLQLFKTK